MKVQLDDSPLSMRSLLAFTTVGAAFLVANLFHATYSKSAETQIALETKHAQSQALFCLPYTNQVLSHAINGTSGNIKCPHDEALSNIPNLLYFS